MRFRIGSIMLLQVFANCLLAQTDTAFWFAAPEIAMHGTYTLDRPIYLRLSAYSISASVTVSQPANSSFSPIIVNIPANTSAVVNLTAFIDVIENKPPDQINNFGIHIGSSAPITAYYEILGGETTCSTCNPEFFSLKGKNALGTSFWIPMQKTYSNDLNYTPAPYSSFDIVATEDNTTVTILPTQNLTGHSANSAFSITLNKGQTYCASSASVTASLHPTGSKVTSSKPIAVTMKEDLLYISGYGSDIMGDQLIPESKIGTEYIVMKAPQSVNDQAVIVATQNGTQVFVNGILQTTLNQAQSYQYALNSSATGVAYINTTLPVYLFQLTTCVGETGGAVLPPIGCNGSSNLSITRSTNQPYYIFLITRTGNESNFLFNGTAGVINASSFQSVPGTSNLWQYAIIDLSSVAIVGSANYVTNSTGLFHLGLLQGLLGGSGYGWFSDFSSLGSTTFLEGCDGDVFNLAAIASSGATNVWYDGSTANTHNVSQSGVYWVQSTFAGCVRNDTFSLNLKPKLDVNLGNDATICSDTVSLLKVSNNYTSYLWQDSSTESQTVVGTTGLYWVQVDSVGFCGDRDSVYIIINEIYQPGLGNDTTLCIGDTLVLGTFVSGNSYQWNNASSIPQLVVTTGGIYSLTVTNGAGCKFVDSVLVDYYSGQPSFSLGSDTTICGDFSKQLFALDGTVWSNGVVASTITINTPGLYWAEATNVCGTFRDTLFIYSKYNDCLMAIPTAFSPNGDGVNDVFKAVTFCQVSDFTMRIYNRWGELVFQTFDVMDGWDGAYKQTAQPVGVFIYYTEYWNECTDEKEVNYGNVTLLR